MAMSNGSAVLLYARQSPTCDIRTGDWLLTIVASKLNPHKLREFARLLGIKKDGTYEEIVKQAEENRQEPAITVSICDPINTTVNLKSQFHLM